MAAHDNLSSRQFLTARELRENYPSIDSVFMGQEHIEDGMTAPVVDTQGFGTDLDDRPDLLRQSTNDRVMEDKLHEAMETEDWRGEPMEPLRDNLARTGGVQNPVMIHKTFRGSPPPSWAKGWLGNGGHRVVSMHDIDPDAQVPVDDNYSSFSQSRRPGAVDFAQWADPDVRDRHNAWDAEY